MRTDARFVDRSRGAERSTTLPADDVVPARDARLQLAAPQCEQLTSGRPLDRGRAGLRADVRDLLVDPVARIARGDDLLQPLRPPRALLGRHGQRRVDRVGQLLDVERVDRQRELAELLVRAGVLAQDRDPVALVDQRPLLGHEVHPVEHRVDHHHVVVLVGGDGLLEVVAQLQVDRHPVRRPVPVVDHRHQRLDLLQVLRVLGHVRPRRHQLRRERDPLGELRVLLEEDVERR